YDEAKQQTLLADPGIIRNRAKVAASILNANAFIEIQKEFGSFDAYIWDFIGGKPIINHWKAMSDVPVSTELSDALSKDLKKRG
ncbi:DNA-3-methyladenine glycosylase I, partial [Thalassospira sp.]